MKIEDVISPAGMRMLWTVIMVVIVAASLYLRYIYKRYRRSPFRIRERCWYSGGLKLTVNIKNKSKDIVEMNAPIVEFRQARRKKRRFRIIPPGDKDIFPLGLSPQTSYEFLVDFIRLYDREPRLRNYQQAVIRLEDKTGKLLARKKVKLKTIAVG